MQDELQLRICLLQLVALEETEEGSAEEMARVVHHDLVGGGVEEGGWELKIVVISHNHSRKMKFK